MSVFSRTAVLGCGLMGAAIIRTLHGRGHPVVGWNRNVAPLNLLQVEGIEATSDLASAMRGSDIVLTVLSSYDVVRSVLGTIDLPQLSGKIIVNLCSGSAQDARDMCEWAHDRNAEYVDGSIWVLPNMIGAPDTVLSCAGPIGLWERIEHTIKLLGGASFYAGEAIENGNVLEACFPGAFYMTAQHCFVESLVRAKRLGIDLNVIARAVTPSMNLLQNSLDDLLGKIADNDLSAHEASLYVWSHAAEGYGKISSAAGLHSPFLDVLRGQLRSAVDAGLGPRGAAAIVGHLE